MWVLTRHFFQGFFRLSFLDDAGEESFRRVIFGLLAGFIAFGLWLPRVFSAKYSILAKGGRDTYLQALLADELLVLCLPMFLVALAMALVCHSLFPDELDYRILMALPVSRRKVFGAKILALASFASIFIVATTVSIAIPFAAVTTAAVNPHFWPMRAGAYVAAGLLAATFAAGAVIAVQGIISVATPRNALRSVSVFTQTAMVCGLVLLLPVLLRVPTYDAVLRDPPDWLVLVPPVWFLGFSKMLLGSADSSAVRLAALAVAGAAAVAIIVAVCYAIVYRRFDRVILRAEKRGRAPKRMWRPSFARGHAPEYTAVRAFTTATLRRSGLHQIVFLGACAAGIALATNGLLNVGGFEPRWAMHATLRSSLILMFATVIGLRSALLLPVTRQAVWVFRLTEDAMRRQRELASVEHLMLTYGVLIPIVVALPFQVRMVGWQATITALPVMAAMGVLLVEIALMRWHRIPFTCTYLPGKRPVAHTFLLFLVSSFFFVGGGGVFLVSAARNGSPMPVLVAILLALAGVFRWVRCQLAVNKPLEFEDEPPDAVFGLHLNT